MRAFKEIRLLLALLLAFVLLWVVLGDETKEEQTDPRMSSYNATYPGCKAWLLLLQGVGIDTRRLTGTFPSKLDHTGVLVLAHPSAPVKESDLNAMLAWARGGGHLLVIGDDFTDPSSGEFQGGVRLTRRQTRAPITGPVPAADSSDMAAYVGKVYAGRYRYTRTPPHAEELYADRFGPLLVTWRTGKGRITALADPYPLTNQYIDREGNARLGVWLAGREPVVFDEYHHGFASEPGFWQQLGAPLRLALYQLIFAALLMAWTYSRRFGPVLLPPFTDRRSAGEYVVSLGSLLHRAHADRTALAVVGSAFRHELAAWVGAPTDLPDSDLVHAALDRAPSVPRDRLEHALAASGGTPPPGMTPIQASRLIASVREELHLNGRPAASARPALQPASHV